MTVTLLDHMGSDITIVNNAKASLDRFSEVITGWDCPACDYEVLDSANEVPRVAPHSAVCDSSIGLQRFSRLAVGDERLLRSLARNRHGTPFEGVVFRLHVDTSIRVSREWFRHRIASYSEMSTRFMVMSDERDNCYIPEGDAWRKNAEGTKIMEYAMEVVTDQRETNWAAHMMTLAYDACFDTYDALVDQGWARELAAFVLPLGMRTAFITTINLRSLFNFLSLRNSDQALYELRQEAIQVEEIVSQVCPVAYDAWIQGDRRPI